jgi:hypothetical protein
MMLPPWVKAALAANLCLYGLTVSVVLGDPSWNSRQRWLDVVEIWSGVASVKGAAEEDGFRAKAFDIINSPLQDICTEGGFKMALGWVLELRENGLLAMAPVCSSWVTLNCVNTKRSKLNLEGEPSYEPVQQGNEMAKAAAFLMLVAIARNVHAYMENPAQSMMFRYLREAGILTFDEFPFLRTILTHRCYWDTAPFGKRYLKCYKFLATGDWISPVAKRCTCPTTSKDQPLHLPLVKLGPNGKRTGLKHALLESQEYPVALGQALVKAWKCAEPAATAWVPQTSVTSTKSTKSVTSRDMAKGWELGSEGDDASDGWASQVEDWDSRLDEPTWMVEEEFAAQSSPQATGAKRKSSGNDPTWPMEDELAWPNSPQVQGANSEDPIWPEGPPEKQHNDKGERSEPWPWSP